MTVEPPARAPVAASSPTPPAPARAPRLVTAGVVATAVGAAGVGASIPSLLSDLDAISVGAASGFALVGLVGAGLIQRGRATIPGGPVRPGAAIGAVEASTAEIAPPAGETPVVAESAIGPEPHGTVADRYRQWVLAQALGDPAVPTLDVAGDHREVFNLSTSGVASLLAWLYDRDRTTYTVERWVDEILPSQGIQTDDRDLAVEVLTYAASRAGGVHAEPPTTRRPDETARAMAAVHVGLLRVYCGIGPSRPVSVLASQFDGTPSSSPSTRVPLPCHTPA